MASDDPYWMEKAFKNAHGQLRAKAHAKKGESISGKKLESLSHSKSLKTRRQANLAKIARRSH